MNKKEIIKGFILELTESDDFLMIQDWQNGYRSNEHEEMYPKLNKLAESLLRGLEASDKQVINDDMVIAEGMIKSNSPFGVTFETVENGMVVDFTPQRIVLEKILEDTGEQVQLILRKVNPITKESK